MRLLLLLLLSCASCHGEAVDGAGAPDAAGETPSEASTDTSSDGDAEACIPAGDLVGLGEFASGGAGWLTDNATITATSGPCNGKGALVKTTGAWGSIGRRIDRATMAGKRVHFAGWIQMTDQTLAPPLLAVRVTRYTDAGEVQFPGGELVADGGAKGWNRIESSFVVDADVTSLIIAVFSRSSKPEEFGVAGLSLTIE